VSEQNYLRADSLVRRTEDPGSDTIRFRMLHAYKTGNAAEARRLSDAFAKTPGVFLATAVELSVMDPHAAEELATAVVSKRAPGVTRSAGLTTLSMLDMEQGQPGAAFARLDSAGEDRIEMKAMYATLPTVQLSREKMQALYDQLLRADSVAPAGNNQPGAKLWPQFRLYHLGMVSCRLGRTAEANAFANRLEAMPVAPYWKESMHALATNVRAQVDVANGDAKGALARLEGLQSDPPLDLLFTTGARLPELMWRAELLYLLGRNDEALDWFENVDDFVAYELPIYSYSMLRRAELLERKGQGREAMALYSQVLKNWSAAEPEFQPLVNQARSRLAMLQRNVD
jgi:tetratricopeptide (TPR) repeat protein